jgi:DNA-binding winged helix-turn-helix (wHTH) protein/TolB-like protein
MTSRHFYKFGPFRLDAEKHRLMKNGEPVPLSPKSAEALLVLVQNAGKLLERETLMQAVWADTFVEDANLTVAISHLRKALAQNGETTEYIETIPRVGYRFLADVHEVHEDPRPVLIEKHTLSRTIIEEEEVPDEEILPVPLTSVQPQLTGQKPKSRRVVMVVAGLLVVAAAVSIYLVLRKTNQPVSPRSINSLAVLPFHTLGPQPAGEEYLGLGLTDSLITRLGQIRRLTVRPTSAIARFADNDSDPLAAGKQLGVQAVLDGRITRDQDRIRVSVQLLRTSDGQPMWSQMFDGEFTNLFTVEDEISQHVSDALIDQLSGEERAQIKKHGSDSPEAFRAFLRGRYALNKRSFDEIRNAIGYFKQSIDLDPAYASAYAGLADCYLLLGDYNWLPATESFPLARAAAQKALEIDDGIAEAHTTLGHVEFDFTHDWGSAEREYRRGLELKPNYATGHHWYALFLSAMGRTEEAQREIRRAEELDPLSLIIKANVGMVDYFARQYDQAIEIQRKAVAADPSFVQGRRKLAFSLEARGLESEAINEWLEVERQLGTDQQTLADFKAACDKSGVRGYWQKAIEVDSRNQDKAYRAASLSSFYARLGQKDEAFYWLNQAVEQRAPFLVYAKVSPVYDNLRSDPRFKEVLDRIGLGG